MVKLASIIDPRYRAWVVVSSEFELPHGKTNKMVFVPSNDSEQPGHPPSLIGVFTVGMKKHWILSYPLSAQRRLIRLGGCPGWSESLLGAQSFCWFCHEMAQILVMLIITILNIGIDRPRSDCSCTFTPDCRTVVFKFQTVDKSIVASHSFWWQFRQEVILRHNEYYPNDPKFLDR